MWRDKDLRCAQGVGMREGGGVGGGVREMGGGGGGGGGGCGGGGGGGFPHTRCGGWGGRGCQHTNPPRNTQLAPPTPHSPPPPRLTPCLPHLSPHGPSPHASATHSLLLTATTFPHELHGRIWRGARLASRGPWGLGAGGMGGSVSHFLVSPNRAPSTRKQKTTGSLHRRYAARAWASRGVYCGSVCS